MTDSSPLRRAVEVMDTLRSPGGCPWDAEQTHASLARYLVEETYEVLEAIESPAGVDHALLREELGDLLLQVLFHARIAAESPDGFDIDDVAGDLTDKLVRRHPHVFSAGREPAPTDADSLNEAWERQKVVEKGRTSALDGVPVAQPALALATKLTSRARRAGIEPELGAADDADARIGHRLLAVVRDAVDAGVDPEGALRRVTQQLREQIRQREVEA